MVKLLQFTISICLVFVCLHTQAMTKLTASVDRNPVMERESFVLEIMADDSVDVNSLDLSKLGRSGLIVGRTQNSSQTQVINGSVTKITSWNVVLVAKSAGTYTIPALELNGYRSQPITVEVVKASQQSGTTNQPIFLKNTIENKEIYLQQSVRMVSRLYFSPKVELQSGSLSEPQLDGALVQQQGKDKETSEIIMGVRYRVIERVYTVTPQSSGTFTIVSPTFNGEVLSNNRRRLFTSFGQTKPVSAFGDDITLTVQPIPADYQGNWLASEIVQLNEEWQPTTNSFEVGEAITRTFTLTALNVNEEQLPEISGQYPDAFKVYPDQSESHSVLRQNALVAQRINSEAIVANRAGTFELPEVKVSWFNTKTKRQETAVLPARQVTVVNPTGDLSSAAALPNTLLQNEAEACPVASPCETNGVKHWYESIWLAASGWVVAFVIALVALVSKGSSRATSEQDVSVAAFDIYALKRACKSNDPKASRAELLKWAQEHFKNANISSLSDLEALVMPQMQREIRRLNLSQYSKTPSEWQGQNLWHTVVNELKRKDQKQTESGLPPLN